MGLLQRLLSVFEDKRELLDVTRFDHPVALQVSWAPLVRGGSNFCTHRAQIRNSLSGSELVFKTSLGAYAFCILFMAVGVIALAAVVGVSVFDSASGAPGIGLFALMPFVFLAIGGLALWSFRRKEARFEQYTGQFIQGTTKHSLRDVEAIQLIREYVRGDKNSYYSYELNLVRRDGSRLNVTDHGSLRLIREDAGVLARYLNRPVWDAIDYRIPDQLLGIDSKTDTLARNLFTNRG